MPFGTTNYPASLDNLTASLVVGANNATTTLTGAHNGSTTTITVNSTSLFPSAGIITIDSERIAYSGKTATTFTGCTRGFEGSAAASHTNGVDVNLAITAFSHNVLNQAIIALETKLGISNSTHADGAE
jgi:hypothetical protein